MTTGFFEFINREDINRLLAQIGCASISDLNRDYMMLPANFPG